jgi:two-component system response regulator MprA
MAKKILIAEDNLTSREMLVAFAEMQGYEVVAVNDGIDLLTIAADKKFDAIITDLMMTHLDGAAATEIMKMQGNRTPVIALTALAPQDLLLVQDKFSRIYHKPCNFSELFEYIESLIGR